MVTEECKWIENLWHNMAIIEECDMSKINAIKQKKQKENFPPKISPCYGCGQIHYYKECPFRRKECFNCVEKGHKQIYCRKPKKQKGVKNEKCI